MQQKPFILENNIATRAQVRSNPDNIKNTDGLYKVNIDLIRIRPDFNPRQKPEGMLEELWEQILQIPQLANDIYENGGPIDPILGDIYKEDGCFYITEGERRFRAIRHLIATGRDCYFGDPKHPVCDVRVLLNPSDTTDKERERIALTSANKMQLTPLQRGHYYKRFKDKYEMSNDEVAKYIGGLSRQTVDNYVNLLEMPEDIQLQVEEGRLSISKALEGYRESKKPTGTQVLVDGDTGEVIEKGPDAGKKPETPKEQSGDEGEFEQQDNSVTFPGSKGGPKEEGSGAHVLGTDGIHLREQKKAGWRNLFHRIEHHKGALVKLFIENEGSAEDKLIERLMNEFDLTAK